jgi:hypothetical protein
MDYAIKNGVSLSTLRRHIKANKIPYKVENGRYLVFDEAEFSDESERRGKSDQSALVRDLKTNLQKAQEEIAELKTLIAFYEERIPNQKLNS